MSRFRSLMIVGLCCCLGSATALADDGYDLIPAEASIVVRLKAPETTISDLAEFVNKVQPGAGAFVEGQRASLGMLIDNPTLDGAFKNSDWYVASFATPDSSPEVVLLIPASDAQKFQQAVRPGYSFAVKGQFVAYSKSASRMENIEACFAGDVAPVSSLLDKPGRDMLNSGHLTMYINGVALKQAFADELADADGKLDELIDSMALQVAQGSPNLDLNYVWDMYRSMGRSLIQAARDSEAMVVRIQATQTSLQIDKHLAIAKNSQTDDLLALQTPGDLQLLNSVPEGQTMYFGGKGDIAPLMSFAERMMSNMPVDDDARSRFEKSFATMKEATFGSVVGGGKMLGDGQTGMQYFGISEITPGSKIREAFAGFEDGFEYEVAGMKQRQSYKANAEQAEGLSVDLFEFEQTMPPELDPLGIQKAMHDKMYGPDGIVQRLAVKGNTLYQSMGGGLDQMKRLLKSTEWSDSTLLGARGRLPAEANLIFLTDLPSLTQQFARLIVSSGVLPIPVTEDQLTGLEIEPSYAGFSITSQPQQVQFRLDLPVETFQGFVKIAFYAQQMRAGGL